MKKALSLLLAVAMIICALPLSTVTAIAETVDIDLSEIADVDIKLPTPNVPENIAKMKAPGVKMASLTAAATPDESGTTGDCTWELYGTKLVISGNGKMGYYYERIDYSSMTYVNDAPWGKKGITEVEIKEGVTSIGQCSFSYCYELISVTIPSSVTSIGSSAFTGCTKLEKIYYNAKSVDDIRYNVDVFAYAGSNGNGIDVVFGDSVEKIPANLFEIDTYYSPSSCSPNIKSVTIGKNVTTIGNSAFDGCESLTSITIPDSVTTIGDYAFNYCTGLTSVTIGKGVTSIGNYAFYKCTGLTDITIPDSVTSIGGYAFGECTGLTGITIPSGVTSIGNSAFYGCTGLTSVIIDNSLLTIDSSVFNGCTGIENITVKEGNTKYRSSDNCLIDTATKTLVLGCNNSKIPTDGSVTSIGNYAFYKCTGLTSVTIPNSVTSIGDSAFDGCTGLTSITIPNSVTSIGDYAFNYCTGLTSVTIGKGVTTIGNSAFQGCKGLTSITIPNSVTEIGSYAFSGCSGLTSVTIGDSVTEIGDYAFNCTGLKGVYITDLAKWCGIDFGGSSSNPLNYAHYLYLNNEPVTELKIPDSVTTIGNYAFYNCAGLTSVTIPDSVTTIGNYAFYNCTGLTGITIPDSVTEIGSYAFSGCSGLTSITVESGNEFYHSAGNCLIETATKTLIIGCNTSIIPTDGSVTTIGDYAFNGRSGLTSITIPDSVTSIGNCAFGECTGLTSITIPDSVTSIGNYAFYGCTGLTSVTIGKGVTTIGDYAFYNCTGLTSITIPDSVTSISNRAFCGCSGLTSITIGKNVTTISYRAFDGCTGLEKIYYNAKSVSDISYNEYVFNNAGTNGDGIDVIFGDNVEKIPARLFYDYSNVSTVTIGKSLTSIGEYAFDGCTELNRVNISDIAVWCEISFNNISANPLYYAGNLYLNGELVTDLVIPDSATSIGNYAFYGCSRLTSVTIPNSVTTIGSSAFYNCIGLTSVTIGKNVTTISYRAFGGCTELEKIYYNAKSVSDISYDGYVFNNAGTNGDGIDVIFGDNVEKIPALLFNNCSNVSTVTIGKNVTSIGDYAFNYCTGLTSITIPDSVTSIGNYAFYNCTGLTRVTIGKNVTSIGDEAFYNCTGLTSITIPDSVTTIGYEAFSGCTGLTRVTIGNSVTSIGNYAFYNCTGLTRVTIGKGVTSIGNNAFYNCTGLTSITIGKGVTTIGYQAFYNCTGLTSVTIPNSVTSIGDYAFYKCSGLTRVTIGKGVTSIGNYAFYNCTGLTSITIPDSVTSIGDYAFSGCTGLEKIYYNAKSVSDISYYGFVFNNAGTNGDGIDAIFGDNVEKIPAYLFYGANIKSAVIGENVTSIGDGVFSNCYNLETVYYKGTEDDRNGITIGSNNYVLQNVEWVYNYSDTEASGTTGDCEWKVTGGKLEISGDGAIGAAGDWGDEITEIEIGEGVTSISAGAFAGCESLVTIKIPETVTSFGAGAFSGCTGLESTKEDIMMSFFDSAAANDDFDINCDGVIDVRDYVLLTYVLVI